ncbi:hypothetical protein Tco_1120783, partial [Tanacetum coccineum]
MMEVVSWGEGWSADEDDGSDEDGWSGVAASVWWFLVSAVGGVDASGGWQFDQDIQPIRIGQSLVSDIRKVRRLTSDKAKG